jgi:RNA polymerase sigma-70 factor (ECF subfamily)
VSKLKKVLPEKELIEELKKKSRLGFDCLYDMYSSSLLGVIRRIVQVEEISEDVLQETFIRVWNSIEGYNPEKGTLFTWLLNISRNMAIDKVRSKGYRNESKNQDAENLVDIMDSVRNTSYNPDTLGVAKMVDQLKPDQGKIVDLIYLKGYTHLEAAEELGIPLGTVKTRLRSGIFELRKMFN